MDKPMNIKELKYCHTDEMRDAEVVDFDDLESLIKDRIKELEGEIFTVNKNCEWWFVLNGKIKELKRLLG